MQIIVFLIVISLTVAVGFLIAFFWAVSDGQYDDDYTPSMRILIEDDMFSSSNDESENEEIKNNLHTKQNENVENREL